MDEKKTMIEKTIQDWDEQKKERNRNDNIKYKKCSAQFSLFYGF